MSLISGTKYYVSLTINQSLVFVSKEYNLYCFSLGNITNSMFWSEIVTSSNIGVVDAVTGLQVPKSTLGFIDTASKKGILYWCGNTYSTAKFYICVGKNLSVSDSTTCFSMANISQVYPCCDSIDSTTIVGAFSNANKISGVHSFNNGLLYRSVKVESRDLYFKDTTSYCGINNRTISCIYKCDALDYSYSYFLIDNEVSVLTSLNYSGHNNSFMAKVYSPFGFSANNAITIGSYGCFAMSYTTSGITNFYNNGVLSGAANQNTGSAIPGTFMSLFSNKGSTGSEGINIEQIIIDNDVISADDIKTRYNMLYNNSSFFGNNFIAISASKPHKNRVNLRLGMCM